MNAIKKEIEEWDKFVDVVKLKKINELYYRELPQAVTEDGKILDIYCLFTAVTYETYSGVTVPVFYKHATLVGRIGTEETPLNDDNIKKLKNFIDEKLLRDIQSRTEVRLVKGVINEV
jgi:hypothetical protein